MRRIGVFFRSLLAIAALIIPLSLPSTRSAARTEGRQTPRFETVSIPITEHPANSRLRAEVREETFVRSQSCPLPDRSMLYHAGFQSRAKPRKDNRYAMLPVL